MRKIIFIGESSLDIDFDGNVPSGSRAGGLFLRSACAMADAGVPTMFISEIGLDPVGEMLVSVLADHGVDISCVDRFSGGLTSTRLKINGETVRYDRYPEGEGFDVSWPRIEKEDVVVFGGYLALDQRVRARLWALVSNAVERKATIVYVPCVADRRIPRITRVMPTVFENLEVAGLVIALPDDLTALYGDADASKAFKNNISFYSGAMCAMTGADSHELTVESFGDTPKVAGTHNPVTAIVNILSKLQ